MHDGATDAGPSRAAPPNDENGGAPADVDHVTCTLAVLTAGMRQPSATAVLADLLADATAAALTRSGASTRLVTVELRPHATALADAMVAGAVPPDLARVVDSVTDADGLIAVTPTFAGSYAGLFKSFFDVLDRRALTGMPVLIGATGGSARHSLVIEYAMRPLLSYFHALVAPTGVFAASDDVSDGVASRELAERIGRAADEMAEMVRAARAARVAAAGQRGTRKAAR